MRDGTKKSQQPREGGVEGPGNRRRPLPQRRRRAPRKRGRPRAYEPDVALARAMDVFWRDGFAATSLDTISAATGMNRPSLYAAFGDKRDIYVKAYQRYRERARERMAEIFTSDLPVACDAAKRLCASLSTCTCRARTVRAAASPS